MQGNITRETYEELGPDLFGCLEATHSLTEGLRGLGQLVWGLAEVAESSEISPEALIIIMRLLYEYADVADEAKETILGMRDSVTQAG